MNQFPITRLLDLTGLFDVPIKVMFRGHLWYVTRTIPQMRIRVGVLQDALARSTSTVRDPYHRHLLAHVALNVLIYNDDMQWGVAVEHADFYEMRCALRENQRIVIPAIPHFGKTVRLLCTMTPTPTLQLIISKNSVQSLPPADPQHGRL
jgi:hypothetical protein